MSLYKDASLVMIPSAYKDGRLYSIRPVEELGSELVTNGDFATDSDWTKGSGSTISGGSLNIVAAPYNANTKQSISLTNGTAYKISIDYTASGTSTSNTFQLGFGDSAGNPSDTTQHEFAEGSGVKTLNVTAASGDATIIFRSRDASTSNLSIHNVSVKEVLVANGDFTFSRGSNLAATRVDVNGLIEKGRENLLLQSNQFDTTWATAANSSVTSGQADKDGGTDAWLLESTATSSSMRLQQDVSSSSILTYSVYAKAGTADWLVLRSNASNTAVWFDLANGVIGQENINAIDSSIESVGNGWHRLSVVFSSCTSVRFYVADGDGIFAITLGANVYIQDAQLEQGLVATNYIETGASTAQAGILEDMPRLDYSGSCPALLLEPQRTNLWTYSEPTSGGAPPIASVTGYSDINEFSSVGLHGGVILGGGETRYQYGGSVSASTTYSLSCYMKTADNAAPILANGSGDSAGDFLFVVGGDARDGSEIPAADYSITLVSNNIYKVEYTFTTLSSVSGSNTGIIKYSGNRNADLEITGFQVEQGSYPTSYIPTYGTSQTRSVDDTTTLDLSNADLDGEDVTYFLEFKNNQDIARDSGATSLRFSSNTSNLGSFRIYRSSSSAKQLTVVFQDNGSAFDPNGYEMTSDNPKVAVKRIWATGQIQVFVDGTEVVDGVNKDMNAWYKIDMEGSGSTLEIKQLVAFPTALTDSECIALTS